ARSQWNEPAGHWNVLAGRRARFHHSNFGFRRPDRRRPDWAGGRHHAIIEYRSAIGGNDMRISRRQFTAGTLAVGAAAACGVLPSRATFAQSSKPTLAFFVKNVTNPFWKACRVGAEKAAKELGVNMEVVAPTKPDNIEEQTRLVEDWIVKKPDAFVFVPVDYKALVPSIQKVNQAGIPIIMYCNDMTDVEKVTFVGSDDEVFEYEISKYLFNSMGGKGKVVHIDGVPAAFTAQLRKKGFERAVKEFPGIEVLASQPGQYRRLPAAQVFENLMQRFPEIDAVVSANDDMAVGIVEALHAAGRGGQKKVVGKIGRSSGRERE